MSAIPPPPPSVPPPPSTPTAPALERPEPFSIEYELREIRRQLEHLPEMRRTLSLLQGSVSHLADTRTVDRLVIGRVERVLTLLAKHLGVRLAHENGSTAAEESRG